MKYLEIIFIEKIHYIYSDCTKFEYILYFNYELSKIFYFIICVQKIKLIIISYFFLR